MHMDKIHLQDKVFQVHQIQGSGAMPCLFRDILQGEMKNPLCIQWPPGSRKTYGICILTLVQAFGPMSLYNKNKKKYLQLRCRQKHSIRISIYFKYQIFTFFFFFKQKLHLVECYISVTSKKYQHSSAITAHLLY